MTREVCFLESLDFVLFDKDFQTVPCMYSGTSEKEKQPSAGMFHNWFKNIKKVKVFYKLPLGFYVLHKLSEGYDILISAQRPCKTFVKLRSE